MISGCDATTGWLAFFLGMVACIASFLGGMFAGIEEERSRQAQDATGELELVDVDGQRARWDKAKGILIDPPFGPWPRPTSQR